jgi:hypothetical protein
MLKTAEHGPLFIVAANMMYGLRLSQRQGLIRLWLKGVLQKTAELSEYSASEQLKVLPSSGRVLTCPRCKIK